MFSYEPCMPLEWDGAIKKLINAKLFIEHVLCTEVLGTQHKQDRQNLCFHCGSLLVGDTGNDKGKYVSKSSWTVIKVMTVMGPGKFPTEWWVKPLGEAWAKSRTRGNQPPKGLREKYSRQRSYFQCKGPEAGAPECEEQQGQNDQSMWAEGGTVETRSDYGLFKPPQDLECILNALGSHLRIIKEQHKWPDLWFETNVPQLYIKWFIEGQDRKQGN